MWERVRPLAQGRPWMEVAQEFVNDLKTPWPTQLCSAEQAQAIGFQLTPATLSARFTNLSKKAGNAYGRAGTHTGNVASLFDKLLLETPPPPPPAEILKGGGGLQTK